MHITVQPRNVFNLTLTKDDAIDLISVLQHQLPKHYTDRSTIEFRCTLLDVDGLPQYAFLVINL